MHVDFVNLKRQNQFHRQEFLSAINKIFEAAAFTIGPELEKFEKSFAKFCHTRYCTGLNSGTDALEFALRAYNIGLGDEVITAPNSYFSTAMVISKVGAIPIFADVDPQTYTIDPQAIAAQITRRTKAIIPIHLYGQTANMDPIIKLARQHHLVIIEDCCQAHGATYKGKVVPVTGTGAFSFYPGKNLGSFGDAGALVTNNRHIADTIKKLRNDGSIVKYHHLLIGAKSRLDNLQAAILNVKLKYLHRWNNLRRHHARLYSQVLKPISQVQTPFAADWSHHIYHLYAIQVPRRDQLQSYLARHGIATVIHYPIPIHLQPAYRHLHLHPGSFPITESLAKTTLSLPMFPELTEKEIRFVVNMIDRFYNKHD